MGNHLCTGDGLFIALQSVPSACIAALRFELRMHCSGAIPNETACVFPFFCSCKTCGVPIRVSIVCYIGTRGKTPEHNQAKHTKHPHSLEWHNSTITIVFPSTLRNTLVVMTKHNATTPNQSTTQKLLRNTQPNTTINKTSGTSNIS